MPSFKLGSSKTSQTQSSVQSPYITNTGYSRIYNIYEPAPVAPIPRQLYGGKNGDTLLPPRPLPGPQVVGAGIELDPSIRGLQDEALATNAELAGGLQAGLNSYLSSAGGLRGQYGDMRARLLGNQGAYMQARVNPLLQQQALRRGEIQRSIGLRGLGGSSFGEQTLNAFDTDAQRAAGDARSLATQEGLQAEAQTLAAMGQIDQNMLQAVLSGTASAEQLNQLKQQISDARLRRELSLFGIGSRGSGTGTGKESGFSVGFGGGGGGQKGGGW